MRNIGAFSGIHSFNSLIIEMSKRTSTDKTDNAVDVRKGVVRNYCIGSCQLCTACVAGGTQNRMLFMQIEQHAL